MNVKHILLFLLLLSPAAAWLLFKPVRVLAPQLVSGISCVTETICMEDSGRYDEADRLYSDALSFLETSVAPFEEWPRVIFCSTQTCFESYGFSKSSAHAVGDYGIVIGPQGWTPRYLRHEMIHHLQAERLGVYKQWRSPDWFIEGMAYSLSEDPRQNLAEPWQQYRARFEEWYQQVGKERLWHEAENL
jgi:hypothetical protein